MPSSPRHVLHATVTLALATALSAIGCSGGGTPDGGVQPFSERASRIEVSPATLNLGPLDTQRLAVTVYGGTGGVLRGRGLVFSTSNNAVAWVNTAGVVSAVGPGSGAVRVAAAENPNVSVTVPVSVRASAARLVLTLLVSGAGRGTLTASVGGLACSTACGTVVDEGTSVTITATPAAGSTFVGWSGGCAGIVPTCALVMRQSTTVTAAFDTIVPPPGDGGGSLIAFASNRDGNAEIYVMRPDGTGVRRLTNDPGVDSDPVLSPDATRIAFRSGRGGVDRIHVMNVDGGGVRVLNPLATGKEFTASWSPDGAWLAYVSTGNPLGLSPGEQGEQTVYVVRADGTAPRPLGPGYMAAWGPTGRIAFAMRNDAGKSQLYTMAADGTDVRPLTDGVTHAYSAAWSPDGRRILFDAIDPIRADESHLAVVNADGTGQAWRAVAGAVMAGSQDAAPAWSPDGTRIVFMSSYGGGGFQLFTTTAAGEDLRQLTTEGRYNGLPSWR